MRVSKARYLVIVGVPAPSSSPGFSLPLFLTPAAFYLFFQLKFCRFHPFPLVSATDLRLGIF